MTATMWVIFGIVALVILVKNPKLLGRVRGGSSRPEFMDPKILVITVGLVVFNLISWAMIPWLWHVIAYTWYTFAIFNLGFGTVLYLRTVKTKDESGKSTKELDPTASRLANIIAVVLVLGFLTTAWIQIQGWWEKESRVGGGVVSKTVTNLSHGAPASIALPIIADCETGGGVPGAAKQFVDEEKKIPVRNPQDGKPGTGAVGKWQINLFNSGVVAELKALEENMRREGRLKNEEKFDVERNETHNQTAAEHLYQKYRTNPWTASQACWEPKLRSYTWGGEAVAMVVIAPVREWSDSIPLPRNGERGGKTSIDEGGKRITILWNDQIEDNVPRPAGVSQKNPAVVNNFRLKSRESKSVPVLVRFFQEGR